MSTRKQQTKDLTLEIGRWPKGMVNAVPAKSLSQEALMDALNIDIDATGAVRRRQGSTQEISGLDCHSIHADEHGLYFVDGSVLKRATRNAGVWTVEAIRSDMAIGRPVRWVVEQGMSWYSNGAQVGKLAFGENHPFSVESPAGQPLLGQDAQGDLAPGRYGVAVCFVNQFGEESSARNRAFIDVLDYRAKPTGSPIQFPDALGPNTARILLSNIPKPRGPEIASVRVYVSEPDGTVLRRYADLPAGTSEAVIMTSRSKGMEMAVEGLDDFPPCDNLQACRGTMFGSVGPYLYFSKPLRFGVIDLAANPVVFNADITMIVEADDGIYITADQTYWLAGADPMKSDLRVIFPFAEVVVGTLAKDPMGVKRWWLTRKGQVMAGPGGQARVVSLGAVSPPAAATGAAFVRRENGIEQVVNAFPSAGSQNMGISDHYEVEIIRKGRT